MKRIRFCTFKCVVKKMFEAHECDVFENWRKQLGLCVGHNGNSPEIRISFQGHLYFFSFWKFYFACFLVAIVRM